MSHQLHAYESQTHETQKHESQTHESQEPLTPEQISQYHAQGFLVVPGLLSDAEITAFLEHHSRPRPAEWQLGLRTHTADPQWRSVATNPRIVEKVRQILGGPPRIVQTMFLNKRSEGGKGLALHQDSHYIKNEPNTLMACWVALADSDEGNGGLCVVPGSHRQGLLASSQNPLSEDHDTWEANHTLRDRGGREWEEAIYSAAVDELDPARILRLTVPRGAGVFFTGLTIHGSFANRSTDRPRPAFATHYVREGTWVYRTDIQDTVPASE